MDKIGDAQFRVMCDMWGVDSAIKAAKRMGMTAMRACRLLEFGNGTAYLLVGVDTTSEICREILLLDIAIAFTLLPIAEIGVLQYTPKKPYQSILRNTLLCPDSCVHSIYYLPLINIFTPSNWNNVIISHIIQCFSHACFLKICFVRAPSIEISNQQVIRYLLLLYNAIIPNCIKR